MGGGRHSDVGLVRLRFMSPGGDASASDARRRCANSGLPPPASPGGNPGPIFRKSKGCMLCSLLRGDTLRGLELMLEGGDDVVMGPLVLAAILRKLRGKFFCRGEMGGGGGGRLGGSEA